MDKTKYKHYLIAFLFAVLGVLLTLASVHLYQDHQNLHAVINIIQQAAQQQGKK